ncbi:hypothetical protein KAU45_02520, partial [bacterium]|nr:hypothetical protein [bacterium]
GFTLAQDMLKSRGIYYDSGLEAGGAYSYVLHAYGEEGGYVEVESSEVEITSDVDGFGGSGNPTRIPLSAGLPSTTTCPPTAPLN